MAKPKDAMEMAGVRDDEIDTRPEKARDGPRDGTVKEKHAT
jgi:hypothetical protein